MIKETSPYSKKATIFSIATIFLGLLLLVYMIVVEDEPGALPLLIVIIGVAWFIINHLRNKKNSGG